MSFIFRVPTDLPPSTAAHQIFAQTIVPAVEFLESNKEDSSQPIVIVLSSNQSDDFTASPLSIAEKIIERYAAYYANHFGLLITIERT